MSSEELDMTNRDPNDLNDHLKVCWEDVIAEPDGAHSHDCSWSCSYKCFQCGKMCCYRLFTALCSCFFALCWGCNFGYLTFLHIWGITPSLRAFAINCGCAQKYWGTCLQCLLAPVCETCGLFLSRVNVEHYSRPSS